MSRQPRNARAFTLIELLVATAMMAVLAGSLYASFHVAFKARQSAMNSVEAIRKLNQIAEMMQADLQSAVAPGGTLAGPFQGSSNGGMQGDDLVFCTAATDMPAGSDTAVGDIKQVEYCCQPSADDATKQSLVRLTTTNLLSPTTPDSLQETVCSDVRSFTLQYFDGTAWQTTWDSTAQNAPQTNALPQAVEITVELDTKPGEASQRMSRVVTLPCGQSAAAASSTGGAP